MKIKLLDPSVANKIAAGEVVERPASIVKELVENSIDAGSTSVTVEIRGGGIDLIRITDNGIGMAEEDVKNAFLRHATSKISVAEDLNDIITLGFRGEALASIAAVSNVTLATRTKNGEAGTEIELSGGVIEKFFPCGCAEGTSITVRDLFFNTPARRKFLKKPSQEASYIQEAVNRLALSNPRLAIRFIVDGKTVLRSPGDNSLLSAIRAIFGQEVSSAMIPVNSTAGAITLNGYIGKREIQRNNRSRQILFINGRSVKNDLVSAAVQQAYAGRLNIGKFPFYVLEMSLDGNLVDVNVHPTKQEVRFQDGLPVYDTVLGMISRVLAENQEIPTLFDGEKQDTSKKIFEVDAVNVRNVPTDTADTIAREDRVITSAFDSTRESRTSLDTSDHSEKSATAEKAKRTVSLTDESLISQREDFAVQNDKDGIKYAHSIEIRDDLLHLADSSDDEFLTVRVSGATDSTLIIRDNTPTSSTKEDGAEVIASDDAEQGLTADSISSGQSLDTDSISSGQSLDTDEGKAESEQIRLEVSVGASEATFITESDYKIVGVLFDTYIIIEMLDDCYMVDQHAAHERLLFEKLYSAYERGASSQLLLIPQIVKLSPQESAIIEELMPRLEAMGFIIDDMGFGSLAIKAVPDVLSDMNAESFITHLLDENTSFRSLKTNELKRSKLMQMACKSAVKGGDKLTEAEIKALIGLIKSEGIPLSCPHGRPILIRLSKHELEVRFKRIQ